MLVSKGLAESMAAVNTMCKGKGNDLMASLSKIDPRQRLDLIREDCKTDRFELVKKPKANTDSILFLLAHVALSELQSKGVTNDEKTLLRYIALAELPPMAAAPKEAPDVGIPDTETGEETQAPRTGSVKISKVETIGNMDKEIIQEYVGRKIPRIQFCYEQTLDSNPKITGTVIVSFIITPNGSVNQQVATGIGEETLEKCVAGAVKSVKFPKPKGGGMVEAKFSFELTSSEASPATADSITK